MRLGGLRGSGMRAHTMRRVKAKLRLGAERIRELRLDELADAAGGLPTRTSSACSQDTPTICVTDCGGATCVG